MAKKPTFSEADLAISRHMLQSLRSKLKGLDELDKLVSLLENKGQIISERKRTLDSINAEIKARENATIDGAVTEGKRQAEKIVAEARRQAEDTLADCAAKRDALTADCAARQAQLDALQEKIAAARDTVRAVLSAA